MLSGAATSSPIGDEELEALAGTLASCSATWPRRRSATAIEDGMQAHAIGWTPGEPTSPRSASS